MGLAEPTQPSRTTKPPLGHCAIIEIMLENSKAMVCLAGVREIHVPMLGARIQFANMRQCYFKGYKRTG